MTEAVVLINSFEVPAADAEQFIAACERQLAMSQDEKQAMAKRMREVVAGTSWDLTASRMHELITSAVPDLKSRRLTGNTDGIKAEVVADVTPVKVAPLPVAKSA